MILNQIIYSFLKNVIHHLYFDFKPHLLIFIFQVLIEINNYMLLLYLITLMEVS